MTSEPNATNTTPLDPRASMVQRQALQSFLDQHQEGDQYMIRRHPSLPATVRRYRRQIYMGEADAGALTCDEADKYGIKDACAAVGLGSKDEPNDTEEAKSDASDGKT